MGPAGQLARGCRALRRRRRRRPRRRCRCRDRWRVCDGGLEVGGATAAAAAAVVLRSDAFDRLWGRSLGPGPVISLSFKNAQFDRVKFFRKAKAEHQAK